MTQRLRGGPKERKAGSGRKSKCDVDPVEAKWKEDPQQSVTEIGSALGILAPQRVGLPNMRLHRQAGATTTDLKKYIDKTACNRYAPKKWK